MTCAGPSLPDGQSDRLQIIQQSFECSSYFDWRKESSSSIGQDSQAGFVTDLAKLGEWCYYSVITLCLESERVLLTCFIILHGGGNGK